MVTLTLLTHKHACSRTQKMTTTTCEKHSASIQSQVPINWLQSACCHSSLRMKNVPHRQNNQIVLKSPNPSFGNESRHLATSRNRKNQQGQRARIDSVLFVWRGPVKLVWKESTMRATTSLISLFYRQPKHQSRLHSTQSSPSTKPHVRVFAIKKKQRVMPE